MKIMFPGGKVYQEWQAEMEKAREEEKKDEDDSYM